MPETEQQILKQRDEQEQPFNIPGATPANSSDRPDVTDPDDMKKAVQDLQKKSKS